MVKPGPTSEQVHDYEVRGKPDNPEPTGRKCSLCGAKQEQTTEEVHRTCVWEAASDGGTTPGGWRWNGQKVMYSEAGRPVGRPRESAGIGALIVAKKSRKITGWSEGVQEGRRREGQTNGRHIEASVQQD